MSTCPDDPARAGSGWPDPSWLFLIAGIGAIAAAVLIPAAESLDEARYRRDVALTWESERLDRLDRHEAYLGSIKAREPATVRQLKALQLNRYPDGLTPLADFETDPGLASASVFALLEPEPHTPPEPPAHRVERSRLAQWATGERSRLWLLAAGGLGVLLGLMPPRSGRERAQTGAQTGVNAGSDATVPS